MRNLQTKIDAFIFGMLIGIGYKVIYGKTLGESIIDTCKENNIQIKFKKS